MFEPRICVLAICENDDDGNPAKSIVPHNLRPFLKKNNCLVYVFDSYKYQYKNGWSFYPQLKKCIDASGELNFSRDQITHIASSDHIFIAASKSQRQKIARALTNQTQTVVSYWSETGKDSTLEAMLPNAQHCNAQEMNQRFIQAACNIQTKEKKQEALNRSSSVTFWTKAATFVAIGGLAVYALEAGLLILPHVLIATLATSFVAAILFTALEYSMEKEQHKLNSLPPAELTYQ